MGGAGLKAKRQKKMPNEKKAKSKSRSRLVHTCLEENDIQSNLIFTDVSSWQASRNKVYERHSFKKKYPRERERSSLFLSKRISRSHSKSGNELEYV